MSTSTTTEGQPAPGPALEREPTTGRRLWTAGTLRYTAGALVGVFFWLLLGDFAFQLKERAALPTLQLLLKQYAASDFIMTMMVGALPQVINVVVGPMIASKSDRHRGRWGRRIPYLVIVTPITMVSMIGLGYSPALGAWAARVAGRPESVNGAVLISFTVFWTVFEFCTVTGTALLMGLVNDVVPQNLIGRFYGLFRIFSVAAGIVFNSLLMGQVEAHFVAIFWGLGIVYGVSFAAMCAAVREPEYPPPPPREPSRWRATRSYLRECFARPYYVWYFASIAVAYLAFQPINLFSLYFAKSLGMTTAAYGYYGAIQYAVSLTMSYPLGWLVDKFHPIRLIMVALLMHGSTTLVAFALVRGPAGFAVAHVICGSLAGFWILAWYPLTPALVPKAKFGQYYAAMTMCYSTAMFVGGFAFGWLFDHIHHQYRYMYLIACIFDFLAIGLTLVLYRQFKRYGGMTTHYAPPE